MNVDSSILIDSRTAWTASEQMQRDTDRRPIRPMGTFRGLFDAHGVSPGAHQIAPTFR
jgi:hypothetical protein